MAALTCISPWPGSPGVRWGAHSSSVSNAARLPILSDQEKRDIAASPRRLYEFVAELDQSHDSILAFIEANCRHAGGKSSDAKVKTLAGTLHALAWMYASIVFDM